MAILFAVFGKIKQIFSSYVLNSNSEVATGPFVINAGIYSMPIVYIIILGCVALIAYFCWQSYRQEIHEEKLQEKAAEKDEHFSSYNLLWANKLINWAYMSSPKEVPVAIQRWLEDMNLTLAKNQSPIKILAYGVREGSIPPWIREIGQPQRVAQHIEIPALLDAQEFGLTVSVQEEDGGRVIASAYTASVSQFLCWYNVTVSQVKGRGFLAKFEADLDRPYTVKFNLKLQSDQRITTTVPEVVADIIKDGVLNTPFYLNVSTWGPVIPVTKDKKTSSTSDKKNKKDGSGDSVSSKSPKRRSKKEGSNGGVITETAPRLNAQPNLRTRPPIPQPPHSEDEAVIRKSNTMPSESPKILSDRLKANQAQGLSGSLSSLAGIKRTPSGRGPAKPIRSREKRIMIKVMKVTGLTSNGPLFCQATLDLPQQKCKTDPTQIGSEASWPNDNLVFDLSSRSSEVKFVLKKMNKSEQKPESTVASAILHLDRIDCDKASEISVQMQTVNKQPAELTLQLDFLENHVDQKFTSPRRSLDLSTVVGSPLADEKSKITKGLASTVSSYSSDNMATIGTPDTTMRTTTTKKSSPKRKLSGKGMPLSYSSPNMKMKPDPKSDVAVLKGSVAESVLKDLSEKAEGDKKSPKSTSNIKKGKSNIDEESPQPNLNGFEETEIQPGKLEKGGEMYYSTNSLHAAQNSVTLSPQSALDNAVSSKSNKTADSATSEKRSQAVKPKKSRRTGDRSRSLVSGINAKDMPSNVEADEWPTVRRSRSLVLNKGKKKQRKTGSATDLHKHASGKEYASYEDESLLNIPENDLQKNTKKKKSKSITKLFSKLGRKPSIRKSKKESDIGEVGEEDDCIGDDPQISITPPSDHGSERNSLSAQPPSSDTRNSIAGSEADSSISEATPSMSESASLNSSMVEDKGLKRSRSLRKRLFGGKRKTSKN